MDSLQPVIIKSVNRFRTAPVPPAAVQGMANVAVVKALNGYNPGKGASLATYLNWHLKKVRAFVVKHQNLGRIPEQRAYRITDFKNARDELTEKFGRPPDALSLVDHLGSKWSIAEVGRMERELRSDLIASKNVEPDLLGDFTTAHEQEVFRYIYHDLTGDERAVFEYSLGLNGKQKLSAGQIARKMSISQPKVSRIRRKIDQKLRLRGI